MELYINDRFRNRKVFLFNDFNFTLKFDSIASQFSFRYFFNPENPEHKELACIGHYHKAELRHNDELILTGYIVSENFSDSSKPEMATFGGYSLPGFLEDCEVPTELYPLQSDGLSIKEIAQKLISKFTEIKLSIDSSVSSKMNEVLTVSTAGEGQKIKQYLSELTTQKNIIMSHDATGKLLFTMAKTKQTAILNFDEGGTPFTKMNLKYNGQAMHSHITIIKDADIDGGNAGEYTIENPFVPFVYRPTVIKQSSGTDIDTELVAKNALANELKGLVLTIETDRWEIDGKIIKPNSIISVRNEKIYLYKKTNWFVESITFAGDNTKTTATLTCVLPEVYNGETPKYLFEGINLHG